MSGEPGFESLHQNAEAGVRLPAQHIDGQIGLLTSRRAVGLARNVGLAILPVEQLANFTL
jgi:hypothetical protein